MRHTAKCRLHNGNIGKCVKCGDDFSINTIVANAIGTHLGKRQREFEFPEGNVKRLDKAVYEMQKDFDFKDRDQKSQALRYFLCNALTNVHLTTHASRCFKKGSECYANLPDGTCEAATIVYNGMTDVWSDHLGNKEDLCMFRFQPERHIEDVFMNTHSPELTTLLGCNNNVMVGMNGRLVIYVTAYGAKGTQKDERAAFEKVSLGICKLLRKQETEINESMAVHQKGFRRFLAGMYTHTSAHICAAPMAHHLALHGSRFQYSHDTCFLPVFGLKQILLEAKVIMRFRVLQGRQVPFHRAMNYLYRPVAMETMGLYQLFSKMDFASQKKAELVTTEFFMFTPGHPFVSQDVAFYRKNECIPVFSRSWLKSTRSFMTSLLSPVNSNHADYQAKEEYAMGLMMLFLPFRKMSDLLHNNSHQLAFQRAYRDRLLDSCFHCIAPNIQVIHNSVDSGIPENSLTAETVLVEAGDFVDDRTDNDSTDGISEEIWAAVYDVVRNSEGPELAAESNVINPEFGGVCLQGQRFKPSKEDEVKVLESVIVDALSSNEEMVQDIALGGTESVNGFFTTGVSELNSLAMQQFVVKHDGEKEVDNVFSNAFIKATGSWQSITAWGVKEQLDMEQHTAFEILAATYVLTFYDTAIDNLNGMDNAAFKENKIGLCEMARREMTQSKPLRMFITGPAGAGKSKLLEALLAYAKMFSQNVGHQFTRRTIRVTALTGVAAMEIGGQTSAAEFQYMRNKRHATTDEIESFSDTRMNIIDEVSFADYEQVLGKISANLQNFTECKEFQYGKTAIVFLGDFCQLEAIGGNSIYKNPFGIYWEQALNCMVELHGTHRYRNCPQMQHIMPDMRSNGLSEANRAILNSRVIDGVNVKMPPACSTRYATYFNNRRCFINNAVFKEYLKVYHTNKAEEDIPTTALVVKAGTRWAFDKLPLTFGERKILFETCSEADMKGRNSLHCDPLLCLFFGCNLMCNSNEDVAHGIANGTTCTFQKAVLKPGARKVAIQMYGYWVYSVSAEDVEYLQVAWQDTSRFDGTFNVYAKVGTFDVKFPVVYDDLKSTLKVKIEMTQFPIVINHATTGHKLQGKSLDAIVVAQWSKVKNWCYVVLSRVRELKGLFLTSKIPENIDFSPAPEYLAMMERLRKTILATPDQIQAMKSTFDPMLFLR